MGCNSSNPVGENDKYAEELFERMFISVPDLVKLRKVFDTIDIDKSGQIEVNELFVYLHMEKTPLNRKLFEYLDLDGNGNLTFVEFVCSLWNLLSIDKKNIGAFVFRMFDHDKTGIFSFEKIKNLAEIVHNQKYQTSTFVRGLVDELRAISNHISVKEFVTYHSKHPALLDPIKLLQFTLRREIVGDAFWCRLEATRVKRQDQIEPDYMEKVYKQYCKKWFQKTVEDRDAGNGENGAARGGFMRERSNAGIVKKPSRSSFPQSNGEKSSKQSSKDGNDDKAAKNQDTEDDDNQTRHTRVKRAQSENMRTSEISDDALGPPVDSPALSRGSSSRGNKKFNRSSSKIDVDDDNDSASNGDSSEGAKRKDKGDQNLVKQATSKKYLARQQVTAKEVESEEEAIPPGLSTESPKPGEKLRKRDKSSKSLQVVPTSDESAGGWEGGLGGRNEKVKLEPIKRRADDGSEKHRDKKKMSGHNSGHSSGHSSGRGRSVTAGDAVEAMAAGSDGGERGELKRVKSSRNRTSSNDVIDSNEQEGIGSGEKKKMSDKKKKKKKKTDQSDASSDAFTEP
jgi:Ca2+-binding EF-hand superfamily protein